MISTDSLQIIQHFCQCWLPSLSVVVMCPVNYLPSQDTPVSLSISEEATYLEYFSENYVTQHYKEYYQS